MGIVEVCAGGIRDCLVAQQYGAKRIELVSAAYLGGVTPSLAVLTEAIRKGVTIPIICMVRPRGGGFCYDKDEIEVMFADARLLLENGAAGLAFGFLTEQQEIDFELTEKMINLCKEFNAESVVHRAFDCADHPEDNVEKLIELGCNRILTSGTAASVEEGIELLHHLHEQYGHHIEFCCGSGVSVENAQKIIEQTGITQLHGTFKRWESDPTTKGAHVDYAYSKSGDYETTDETLLSKAVEIVNRF